MPPLGNGFRVTASVEVGADGGEGIVYALGDWTNGAALYLLRGRLVHVFNGFGHVHRLEAPSPLRAGRHTVRLRFERDGLAVALVVDGREVASHTLPHGLPFRWQIGGAGLTIGYDRGFPVCDDYAPPFEFRGTLHEVVFELPWLAPRDAEVAARADFELARTSE